MVSSAAEPRKRPTENRAPCKATGASLVIDQRTQASVEKFMLPIPSG